MPSYGTRLHILLQAILRGHVFNNVSMNVMKHCITSTFHFVYTPHFSTVPLTAI